MNFVNLCPHTINVMNAATGSVESFQSAGIARVSSAFTEEAPIGGFQICSQTFGEVTGLPAPQQDTVYIVSGVVLAALKGSRPDVVGPNTGPSQVRFTPEEETAGLGKAGQTKYVMGFTR